mgnify:CR=1 FL=1
MSRKNEGPIVLNSPVPLDDGGRKYNILYVVLGGGAAIFGSGNGWFGAVFLGLLGIMIAYTIKSVIVDLKWKNLRKLKFAVNYKLEYDELIKRLFPTLSPLNMRLEKHKDGYMTVTYKNIFYDVIYNDDQTFIIWWRKSLIRAFIPKGAISYYPDAVKAMGIIGYYVQQVCVPSEKDVVKTAVLENAEDRAQTGEKYCTECGTKCKSTDAFCPNCGAQLR